MIVVQLASENPKETNTICFERLARRTTLSEWVLGLGDTGAEDIALAGRKGASLALLVRIGLPVPSGFVLTTKAYRSFVETYGLHEEYERLAGQADSLEPGSVEEASSAIRNLFENRVVPEPIRAAIAEAYAGLGDGPVAVRSSAAAEDLPSAIL